MSKKQQSERLFTAIGDIDDRYIDEALEKNSRRPIILRIIALAACFAIFIGLTLYLFIPINDAPNISGYSNNEYYPLIASIANYYYRPHGNKNNFESIMDALSSLGSIGLKGDASPVPALPENNMSSDSINGLEPSVSPDKYFEVTDNQVAGVIEADLIKASDSHLYRVSYRNAGVSLKVYAIKDGSESTDPMATLLLEKPDGITELSSAEMYLSADLATATVICNCADASNRQMTAIYSINVTDPQNPTVTSTVTVSGAYNTSRKIGDQIIVITSYYIYKGIDYKKPETFVPTVNSGKGSKPVPMSDIVMPEVTSGVNYGVVMLIGEGATEPTDTLALFNFAGAVYVNEDSIFATHGYSGSNTGKDENYFPTTMTEILHITTDDGLTLGGKMTVEGRVKDQYSMDEKDGFLRLVTTTTSRVLDGNYYFMTNASLYIFDLSDYSERRSIKYFAPDGEEAMSVRFDGDKLYVCTAEVITTTDPVYFFDLSDYDNMTSIDTGVIDGYSTSLIQLGGGYLLGVGIDAQRNVKLEIYAEGAGSVVSTDCIVISGDYSTVYKSYLIDRQKGIFGMQIMNYRYVDQQGMTHYKGDYYLIFSVGDGDINLLHAVSCDEYSALVRAFIKNGIVYISTNDSLIKQPLDAAPEH